MLTIQIILIGVVLSLLAFLLLSQVRSRVQAGMKLGFAFVAVLAIYAVVRPDDLTTLANALGVDRGTDLLLYALVVAFGISTLSSYLRGREQEIRFARLARVIALQEAERRSTRSEDRAQDPLDRTDDQERPLRDDEKP